MKLQKNFIVLKRSSPGQESCPKVLFSEYKKMVQSTRFTALL